MHAFLKCVIGSLVAVVVALPSSATAQTAKAVPQSQMEMQLSFAPLVKQLIHW